MLNRAPLRQRLVAGLDALSLNLADAVIDSQLDYLELLTRWNASYNLTAVRDPMEMVTRHLLDSLAVLPHLSGASLADLGTGAGIPGIPLALARRDLEFTLVDANGKKARFLREAVRQLKFDKVHVLEGRVETVSGSFDCITARAFASLADMLGWGGHLLAAKGRWLALKGKYPQDEVDALPDGFALAEVHELKVPGLDAERHLLVLERRPSLV